MSWSDAANLGGCVITLPNSRRENRPQKQHHQLCFERNSVSVPTQLWFYVGQPMSSKTARWWPRRRARQHALRPREIFGEQIDPTDRAPQNQSGNPPHRLNGSLDNINISSSNGISERQRRRNCRPRGGRSTLLPFTLASSAKLASLTRENSNAMCIRGAP